jgi:putative restriction endonuclease
VSDRNTVRSQHLVLPNRYSPLQANGKGIQSIYLTEVPTDFAEVLGGLIGAEAQPFLSATEFRTGGAGERIMTGDDLDVWEHRLEEKLAIDTSIRDTVGEAIIRARCGQSLFKQRVMQIERRCRITAVESPIHLVASHCKPWRDSSNDERLDGENGPLMTPSIDHLFDRGFIGFEDSGTLIISPVAHLPSLQRMGIESQRVVNVGGFTEGQRVFLDFHRNAVLLRAVR